jgi:regulator of nucleoside diphosphate kinase
MHRRRRAPNHTRKPRLRGLNALEATLRPALLEHDDYHDGWTAIRPRTFAVLEPHEQQEIVLTEQDAQKLRGLMQEYGPYVHASLLTQLEAELDRALLVDQDHVPSDVVTMNSRVLYEDRDSGELAETRLVYRDPLFSGESHVSVLAPIGAALLGLSVGQAITWPYAGRDALRLRVAALLYQPEAAGAKTW